MSKTLLAVTLAFVALGAQAAESLKLTVNGMVCAFCAQGIEKRVGNMPATKAVYVNLPKKIVAVEAKDGQTLNVDQLRAEIKEVGYDVVKVEAVPQSVEAIRGSMKAKK